MTRLGLALAATGALLVLSTGVASAGRQHRGRATATFPAEGVTLTPAPASYRPPRTARQVQWSFDAQRFTRDLIGDVAFAARRPALALRTVHERYPTFPGQGPGVTYPAWVATVNGTPPISIGGPADGGGPAAESRCVDVAIFDLANSAWTDFFQSCH